MVKKTESTPLREAIDWAGSEEALAHELRIHRDTIDTWVRNNRVPKNKARTIALLMGDEDIERRLYLGW